MRIVLEYFHPWPNSAGLHLAAARGWLGPDVELALYDPLVGDGLTYLRRGLADAAVVPVNRLLVQRERGLRARALAAVNHRAMETVQTVRATGIARPRDLAGRRIALNPTPRGVALVRHLVAVDGGDPDAVVLVDAGVRELPAEVLGAGGPADATFGGYWAWDVLFARVDPAEHVVWPVDAIGAPAFQPYVLVARDDLGDAAAAGLLDGAARGWRAAAAEPEAALALLDRVIPYFPRDTVARSFALVAPTWFAADGGWGAVDRDVLAGYAAWLRAHAVLGADVDPARAADAAVRAVAA
jgi:NitT/TauT family transport system substrate-binding protein